MQIWGQWVNKNDPSLIREQTVHVRISMRAQVCTRVLYLRQAENQCMARAQRTRDGLFIDRKLCRLRLPTVCSLVSEGSFLLTHCPQICIRKEISRSGFLDVNRYSVVHSIDLRRVFFALRKYFDTHFWGQCVMPKVVWWVVWAESSIQI